MFDELYNNNRIDSRLSFIYQLDSTTSVSDVCAYLQGTSDESRVAAIGRGAHKRAGEAAAAGANALHVPRPGQAAARLRPDAQGHPEEGAAVVLRAPPGLLALRASAPAAATAAAAGCSRCTTTAAAATAAVEQLCSATALQPGEIH